MSHTHEWAIDFSGGDIYCEAGGCDSPIAFMSDTEAEHRLNTFDALYAAAKTLVDSGDNHAPEGCDCDDCRVWGALRAAIALADGEAVPNA